MIKWDKRDVLKAFEEALGTDKAKSLKDRLKQLVNIRKEK